MTKNRKSVSVEWVFKEIINYFKFLDFKKNLKIELSAVGKTYMVCALLTNARICLYRGQTSEFLSPHWRNIFLHDKSDVIIFWKNLVRV